MWVLPVNFLKLRSQPGGAKGINQD